jgi:hypothetical protein
MKISLSPFLPPLALLSTALLFAACDSTTSDPPATIQPVGGATPTAAVGTTLPDSLAVVVLDADGEPVRGARVTWAVATDRGGSVSPAVGRTDRDGVAKTAWTLGNVAGEQKVTATVASLPPVEFTATATASALVRAVIAPDSARLFALGRTAQFTGIGYDAFDNIGFDATLRFVSLDTLVATVTPSGTVTARGNGTARIVFVAGTGADTARVRVRQIPREVRFAPDLDTIAVDDTLRATAYDTAGFAIEDAVWSRSSPAVVSVSATGLVRGEGPGTSLVTATAGGVGATRALVVVDREPLGAVALSAGTEHVCAVTSDGTAYCWGKNYDGQLGVGGVVNGNQNFRFARPTRVDASVAFDTIAAGGTHTCALTAAGQAYCWGNNVSGELGATSSDTCVHGRVCAVSPIPVTGGLAFRRIRAGGGRRAGDPVPRPGFTCALTAAGQAYCWGDNHQGQLGDGTTTSRAAPGAVAGGLTFASIDAGASYACGVTAAGAVHCWGYLVPMGGGGAVTTPTQVSGALAFRQVSAGFLATCGVSTTGQGYCWGIEFTGELGNGPAGDSPTPTLVLGGHTWRNIEVGDYTACGLTTGGETYCWGIVAANNDPGSVRPAPVLVPGPTFTRLSSNGGQFIQLGPTQEYTPSTTCGIAAQNRVWCRGGNYFGQVGIGTFHNLVEAFTEVLATQ